LHPEQFLRQLLDQTRKGWVTWRGRWDDRTCVTDGTTVTVSLSGWRWTVSARPRVGQGWTITADDDGVDHLGPVVTDLFSAATPA